MESATPSCRTRAALVAALCALGAAFASTPAMADGSGRERADPTPVVVEVDAIGLIESWAAGQNAPGRPSTARVQGSAQRLLFSCRPGWSLYVTVEDDVTIEDEAAGAGHPRTTGFGCQPGEALVAMPEGLACTNWPPQAAVWDAAGPSVIIAEDAAQRASLTGECMGPGGGIEAAAIAADLDGPPVSVPHDCAGPRSTVTFRGEVTAGGC